MATLIVTTKDDTVNPGDGVLSLREALAAADATATEADTITFDLVKMDGNRIVLAGSELTVDSDVTIDGGSGIIIDANFDDQVLIALEGTFTDRNNVNLNDLTLTHGRITLPGGYGGGAGICVQGRTDLSLSNCVIDDNQVHVIGETGAFGGGIGGFRDATITIDSSTISNNVADGQPGYGGGIWSSGPLTIRNSTIAYNTVIGRDYYASGGGVAGNADVILIQDTIIGNICDGDRWAHGGGILVASSLENCIVAGNQTQGLAGGQFDDVLGFNFSNGHNIFGSSVAGASSGDVQNVPINLLFAGGLADNGGPAPTVALLDDPTNPALGGADPADAPATDQRGVARPQPEGTNPDIGAFELNQTIAGPTVILGTNRSETLLGTAGDDLMRAFGGNDILRGFGGDDQLFGGNGNDLLLGKGGLDRMHGGAGADKFALRLLSDAPANGPAYDEVLDFSRAQHDLIDVSRLDAKGGVVGNQAFTFIGTAEFSAAGQLRYEVTADGDFLVSGSADRDLDAEFAIVVHTDLAALKAADFVL